MVVKRASRRGNGRMLIARNPHLVLTSVLKRTKSRTPVYILSSYLFFHQVQLYAQVEHIWLLVCQQQLHKHSTRTPNLDSYPALHSQYTSPGLRIMTYILEIDTFQSFYLSLFYCFLPVLSFTGLCTNACRCQHHSCSTFWYFLSVPKFFLCCGMIISSLSILRFSHSTMPSP